jgi:hypothetical protein
VDTIVLIPAEETQVPGRQYTVGATVGQVVVIVDGGAVDGSTNGRGVEATPDCSLHDTNNIDN